MSEANQPGDARLGPIREVYERAENSLLVYGMVGPAMRILATPMGPGDWADAHLRLLKWLLPLRITANFAALVLIVGAFVFGYSETGARSEWMIYALIGGFGLEVLTRLDYTPRMRKAARAFAHGLPPDQAPGGQVDAGKDETRQN